MSNVTHRWQFADIDSFLTAAENPSEMDTGDRSSRQPSSDWYGNVSWEQTLELARLGWPDGARRAREFSARLLSELSFSGGAERTWIAGPYGGGSLQMPAYLQGAPNCYLHPRKIPSNKFARVVISGTVSAVISADTMIARGVVATVICDALEAHNYRVQIDLAQSTGRYPDHHETFITLKNYQEPLDLDRVVFFAAHPASLRRLAFSFWETQEKNFRHKYNIKAGGGYGRPCEVEDRGEIYFPMGSAGQTAWSNPAAAIEHLRKLLAERGIEL